MRAKNFSVKKCVLKILVLKNVLKILVLKIFVLKILVLKIFVLKMVAHLSGVQNRSGYQIVYTPAQNPYTILG